VSQGAALLASEWVSGVARGRAAPRTIERNIILRRLEQPPLDRERLSMDDQDLLRIHQHERANDRRDGEERAGGKLQVKADESEPEAEAGAKRGLGHGFLLIKEREISSRRRGAPIVGSADSAARDDTAESPPRPRNGLSGDLRRAIDTFAVPEVCHRRHQQFGPSTPV